MIAFQALTAGAQYMGEKAQGEATYDYQIAKQKATIATAADAARHQYQGNADRMDQVRQSAAQDIKNLTSSYLGAEADARSSAAAGGVQAKEDNFANTYQEHHATRLKNLSWEERQLTANSRGIAAQTRARVEGTAFAPVPMPSMFGVVSAIAGSVFDAYSAFPEHSWFEGWDGT
tara:strand:+ start:437 stop:961 length:525 start_codon:yes stop_codon:yes gene_type:complete